MLIGTIIGVGIFGVPYVVAQSGVAIGLIHFAVLTLAVLLVHLWFGELTLRTNAHHRIVGYAERYLGPWGKRLAALAGIGGVYGALLAYLIVSGSFLHQLLGPALGGTDWHYSVAFGALAGLAVAFGLRLVEELEFILTAFLFIAMSLILIVGAQRVDTANFSTVNLAVAFLPYGAILFSLSGASAIAEIRDILRGRERFFGRAIVWGTLIASVLTLLFVLTIIGVSGDATTPEAIAGLAPVLGRSIVVLGAVLGFLAIATSFLALGLYLHEVFRFDFHLSKLPAFLLGIGVPLLIFLIGNPAFTQVILVTGGIFGGLDGLLIALLVLKARKHGDRKPEFRVRLPAVVNWIVALLFAAGIAVTVLEAF
jgi:tyrosine-specific transport protein